MWINTTTCKVEYLQVAIGRLALISNILGTNLKRFSNDSASLEYPQVTIGRLTLISNDLGTNFKRFSNDSASLFWV